MAKWADWLMGLDKNKLLFYAGQNRLGWPVCAIFYTYFVLNNGTVSIYTYRNYVGVLNESCPPVGGSNPTRTQKLDVNTTITRKLCQTYEPVHNVGFCGLTGTRRF
ncbi:hypothetical protein HanRHA438_Chr02g0052781 [Helianthus annuus]|nr:hypothetical protein HanRHA438_Chr02g0052781 [Helianthus annuus]